MATSLLEHTVSSLLQKVLNRHAHNGSQAGIAFCDGSFALAVVRRDGDARPCIDHCAAHSIEGALVPRIKGVLDRLSAPRAAMCAVLDPDDYQIVQVESPDVLPSEMRAAIRWRLRDAISFNIDDATIDVFQTPEPARRTEARMLFAVAARSAAVERIGAALRPAAKGFNAIDVPELCLRNISAAAPQDARGVALLALHERFVQVVVTRQRVMYLNRRIDVTRRFEPHAQSRGGVDAAQLALELQRSLDYYESHYDQSPIGDLIVAPANDQARALADELKRETSLRISVFEPRDLFGVSRSGDVVADWPTLMALGAALRIDEAQDQERS